MGNEVKGVPDKFLNIADMGVEIPQFGHVRSLNVHVSLSILVWKYVEQWGF